MLNNLPNLRHLRALCEVAACRSISQAAERVFISQPAITQAIAKLEEQIGVTLFERLSDGMRPTPVCAAFALRVKRALELIRQGGDEAVRLGSEQAANRQADFDRLLTSIQLRALVAVAQARNFSLAARSVGTSQPALHRAARDVETMLGVDLFEKTRQGIELTQAGQVLVQHVKLAFAELSQGFDEIEASKGIDTGHINVGSMPLARHSILPIAINALTTELPELSINVVDAPYGELLHELRHGGIDFLIGALRNPLPVEDVVQETLFEDPLAIVARKDHPLSKRGRLTAADLAAYPWILPPQGTPTRIHFDHLMQDQKPAGGVVESSSIVLVCSLLMESNRLTLISPLQVQREVELGLLTILPMDMHETLRPIGLTMRRDWHPTAAQARFLQLVRDTASKISVPLPECP